MTFTTYVYRDQSPHPQCLVKNVLELVTEMFTNKSQKLSCREISERRRTFEVACMSEQVGFLSIKQIYVPKGWVVWSMAYLVVCKLIKQT